MVSLYSTMYFFVKSVAFSFLVVGNALHRGCVFTFSWFVDTFRKKKTTNFRLVECLPPCAIPFHYTALTIKGLQDCEIRICTLCSLCITVLFSGTTYIFMSLSPQQCSAIPSYLAIWSSSARRPASLAYFSWHYRKRPSRLPPGLRRRSAACRLLKLIVRRPTGAWLSVSYECCTRKGVCDGKIPHPGESYRGCACVCVVQYDQVHQ